MTPLEASLARILALRDSPAVRRLCLDCWLYAEAHGEAAGLSFADMLYAGVWAYKAHESQINRPLYTGSDG